MLYTRKGDKGTTRTYGCNQRISKSSAIAEALGSLDEITHILEIQQTLFMIQAEVAGFPMKISAKKVKHLEALIDEAEKILPPIKTFFISGGTELAATFDFARTLARRAERRVVAVHEAHEHEKGAVKLGPHTLPYLNRLSSILYAFARLANYYAQVGEEAPKYK